MNKPQQFVNRFSFGYLCVAFVLVLAFGFSNTAAALDQCDTGSWYDPGRDGEGINLEVTEDLVVMYFYTYDNIGHTFYVGVGANGEVVQLELYETYTDRGFPKGELNVGTATLSLEDGFMLFDYHLNLDTASDSPIPYCIGLHCDGQFIYERLTQPIDCG